MIKANLISLMLLTSLYLPASAQAPKKDIRMFVTTHYMQGLPYDEAQTFGKEAVPQLISMLQEKGLEEYYRNIVTTLGYIGDPSATIPLIQFVETSSGEVSVHKFRAILSTFQALGHISQTADKSSLQLLKDYVNKNTWKTRNLNFSYHQYKGEALSEVLGRQAVQGLGISGRPEALQQLQQMKKQNDLRKDWIDNVDDALNINGKVRFYGARKVFGTQEKQ